MTGDILKKIGNSKTDEEAIDALNEFHRTQTASMAIQQHIQGIQHFLAKIEGLTGYLYQEDVDVEEILTACSFIKSQLDSIVRQAQDKEVTTKEGRKQEEQSQMKLMAARKLAVIGKSEEAYRALYNIANENKNTAIGKIAEVEAKRILNQRMVEIARTNEKESTNK